MKKLRKASCSQTSLSTQEEKNEAGDIALSSSASLNFIQRNLKKKCSKFRFQGEVYSEGDIVMLSDGKDGYFIAKIIRFIPQGGIAAYKNWPTIRVKWYYRKSDILKWVFLEEDYGDYLSEYEVFMSDHSENVIIESIISKCSVMTIDDYEKHPNDSNIFFTRAAYNHNKVI